MTKELARHWVQLPRLYDPEDYVDFWLGMGLIEKKDYMMYVEIVNMDHIQLNSIRAELSSYVSSFTALLKNMNLSSLEPDNGV